MKNKQKQQKQQKQEQLDSELARWLDACQQEQEELKAASQFDWLSVSDALVVFGECKWK